jgi:hypothetical protein
MKNIPGGLGDKMEDWVERQHQWGMRQRRRFRTVQDPLVRALAREKATSRNTHPDVLAQVDATDTGNKRKLSEKKADIISTRRKLQRDVGRFQAIKYFADTKEQTLPWAEVLFYDGKVDFDCGEGQTEGATWSATLQQGREHWEEKMALILQNHLLKDLCVNY